MEANKCRRRGSLVRPRLLLLRAAKGNGTPPNPPTTCSSPRSCPRSVPTRRCSLRSGPGRSKGTGRGRSCSASSSRKGRGGRGSSREVRLRRLRALRPRPRTKSRVLASSRRGEGGSRLLRASRAATVESGEEEEASEEVGKQPRRRRWRSLLPLLQRGTLRRSPRGSRGSRGGDRGVCSSSMSMDSKGSSSNSIGGASGRWLLPCCSWLRCEEEEVWFGLIFFISFTFENFAFSFSNSPHVAAVFTQRSLFLST